MNASVFISSLNDHTLLTTCGFIKTCVLLHKSAISEFVTILEFSIFHVSLLPHES